MVNVPLWSNAVIPNYSQRPSLSSLPSMKIRETWIFPDQEWDVLPCRMGHDQEWNGTTPKIDLDA